jgi:hypothetical protein
MSQFLWVEDFGHADANTTITSVFGNILANQAIPDNKHQLKKLLANQGILLKLDFLEALEFIRHPEQLLSVDYIILDVWLAVDMTKKTSAETGEYLQTLLQRYHADKQTAGAQLEKMAGYQLYVELIMSTANLEINELNYIVTRYFQGYGVVQLYRLQFHHKLALDLPNRLRRAKVLSWHLGLLIQYPLLVIKCFSPNHFVLITPSINGWCRF